MVKLLKVSLWRRGSGADEKWQQPTYKSLNVTLWYEHTFKKYKKVSGLKAFRTMLGRNLGNWKNIMDNFYGTVSYWVQFI